MGLPPVRSLRGSRTWRRNRRLSLDAFSEMRSFYLKYLPQMGADEAWLKGKRVLEVGPGDSLVIPFWFIARGASQGTGIDRYMELSPFSAQSEFYSAAAETMSPEERARIKDLLPWTPLKSREGRLRYFVTPVEKAAAELDGSFHLIVSYNALTYVYDVGETMASSYRLLAPRGIMVHRIPCGSSGSVAEFGAGPLNQLTFSQPVWNLMFSNRMATNRQPISAYLNACAAAGFREIRADTIHFLTDEQLERALPTLHPDFRNRARQDLRIYCFALTATKK